MRPQALLGTLLIIIGVLILVFGGFSFTRERKVLDLGPLQVRAQERERVPISPLVGYGCVIVGGILLLTSGRAGRR